MMLDGLARRSRLAGVHPGVKLLLVLCGIVAAWLTVSWAGNLLLAAVWVVFCRAVTVEPPPGWWLLWAAPLAFLAPSMLVLSVEISLSPSSIGRTFDLSRILLWTTPELLDRALLVAGRALASAYALLFLALTTPWSAILRTARDARVPAWLLQLVSSMLRMILLFWEEGGVSLRAIGSRGGWNTWRTTWRSSAWLFTGVVVQALRHSRSATRAAAARCGDEPVALPLDPVPWRRRDVVLAVPGGLALLSWPWWFS